MKTTKEKIIEILKMKIFADCDGVIQNLDEVANLIIKVSTPEPLVKAKACTCNAYQLENYGCQCGAKNNN